MDDDDGESDVTVEEETAPESAEVQESKCLQTSSVSGQIAP